MKQVCQIKSLAALCGMALAAMMLNACSSDDQDATTAWNDSQWDGRIVLSSNVNDITRATSEVPVTQGSNLVFPSGTDVDLFISENGSNTPTYTGAVNYLQATTPTGSGASGVGNFSFFSNAGRSSSVTRYWPASGNGLYFYAYYPADAITGTVTSTTTTPQAFECGTSQGGADDAKAYDLMFGVPTANPVARPTGNTMAAAAVNLNFTHCLSKVEVTIQGDGNGIAAADAQLTGATVELGNANMYNRANVVPSTGVATATGTANQTFTVKAAGNTALTNYCIIPPQELTGKTIKVTLADGGVKTYTIPTVTAQAGRKYTFTITVGLYSLSVTSTVTDWATGLNDSATIFI